MTSSERNSKILLNHPKLLGASLLAWVPFLLAAALFFPVDPDLGYHLTIGYLILDSGLPTHDLFRVGSEVQEIAYSWLPGLTLALAYDGFGVFGLRLWVLVSCVVLACLVSSLCSTPQSLRARLGLLCVAAVSLIQVISPRPRLWSFVFFALLLLVAKRRALGEISFSRSLIALFFVTVLWANSHVSVFLAPAIVGLVYVSCLFGRSQVIGIREALAAVSVSLAAILCTPYHYKLFTLLSDFAPGAQGAVAGDIVELQGLLSLSWPWPVWFPPGLVLIAVFAYALCIRFSHFFASPFYRAGVVLCLGFLLLSLSGSRHFGFFVITSVATFLPSTTQEDFLPSLGAALTGVLVAMVAIVVGLTSSPGGAHWYAFDPRDSLPVTAVELVLEQLPEQETAGERMTILTPFDAGHFVNYRLYESKLLSSAGVYLDGRTDRIGAERFLEVKALYAGTQGLDWLRLQDISYVIVKPDTALYQKLEPSREWERLGGDERGAAFRRLPDAE